MGEDLGRSDGAVHSMQSRNVVRHAHILEYNFPSVPSPTPQFAENQEVKLSSHQYPTPEDIPGCMEIFDQAIVRSSASHHMIFPHSPKPISSVLRFRFRRHPRKFVVHIGYGHN